MRSISSVVTPGATALPASCSALAAILDASRMAPGVTTDEIDRIAHEYMLDHGAYPSTLGYMGVRNTVADDFIQRNTAGLRKTHVAQRGWVCTMVQHVLVRDAVTLLCGHAGCHR